MPTAYDVDKVVTPFVGVWIEISVLHISIVFVGMSLPSWECGLKYSMFYGNPDGYSVTPFVGVWIEISELRRSDNTISVTPFVGVWIEIKLTRPELEEILVTPFVGVWIEI